MARQATLQHIVGQTKDVGFQISARRTFDAPSPHAWDGVLDSLEEILSSR